MEDEHETSSLRARRKKSSVSLSCCFNGHRRADSFDVSSSLTPSPKMSPSAWIRSKTNDFPDIKIKGRCRNLMSRMGRHRRHSSAEFSYDPLSYALNFEDNDHDSSEAEEFPMRSFASRLPASPPPAGGRMAMPHQHHELPTTSRRAAAVAEVRRSLELPTSRKVEELRSSRSSETAEVRRSLDIPTPRKVVTSIDMRRSLDDVSPALVVSPTSRQVLVELC